MGRGWFTAALREGAEAPAPAYVSDFLASSDGHALVRASMRIRDPAVRRSIAASSSKLSVT